MLLLNPYNLPYVFEDTPRAEEITKHYLGVRRRVNSAIKGGWLQIDNRKTPALDFYDVITTILNRPAVVVYRVAKDTYSIFIACNSLLYARLKIQGVVIAKSEEIGDFYKLIISPLTEIEMVNYLRDDILPAIWVTNNSGKALDISPINDNPELTQLPMTPRFAAKTFITLVVELRDSIKEITYWHERIYEEDEDWICLAIAKERVAVGRAKTPMERKLLESMNHAADKYVAVQRAVTILNQFNFDGYLSTVTRILRHDNIEIHFNNAA